MLGFFLYYQKLTGREVPICCKSQKGAIEMEIRYAQLTDLPTISRLEQASFKQEEQIADEVLEVYLTDSSQTCLVMEHEGEVIAYLLSLPSISARVTDGIFFLEKGQVEESGEHLAIASLVVSSACKGQGVGTLLLAALKEVAQEKGLQGISLTCKESLVGYYEQSQFEDCGPSESQFGGRLWYDMYWKCW